MVKVFPLNLWVLCTLANIYDQIYVLNTRDAIICDYFHPYFLSNWTQTLGIPVFVHFKYPPPQMIRISNISQLQMTYVRFRYVSASGNLL